MKAGDPAGGLLPYVFRIEGLANGQGDQKIRGYTCRVCLTTDPTLRIPIEKPAGDHALDHEWLRRNFGAHDDRRPALNEPLGGQGAKVDWNNLHAVGSDLPGANGDDPEANAARRREIEPDHETCLRGFLWTLSPSPRVPAAIRQKGSVFGLAKDEFTDHGGWPWTIYLREARRRVTGSVMTQHACEGKRRAPDPVALGSFGMDSRVVQHFGTERGFASSDGVIWRVLPKPSGISSRSIIPRTGECENLLSSVGLSATHVAHGSLRMEPVLRALGQSAATAAGAALDQNTSVQDVACPLLRERLLAGMQVLAP